MLEILSRGFRDVKQYLQGMRALNEENLAEALKMIRVSLLEADVEFQVARSFLDNVKEQALGEIVQTRVKHKDRKLSVTPGDHFIRLCHDELCRLMGPEDASLDLKSKPSTIMMVGLQGSGKTTTAGKLARYLSKNGRSPLLVAADIYRPAAIEQLKKLGSDLGMPVYSRAGQTPPEICRHALEEMNQHGCDVAIFDTAGRLTVDEALMEELHTIQEVTSPQNILLVCDAMIGQESVNVAKAFNEKIRLTGFILTKLDGDARGGAAISIKEATGVPIKFVGMGESLDRLEEFRPEGLASRILGFGDIVGLVKDFEEVVDEKKAEEDAKRMLMGNFTLTDFMNQIKTIKKMGPLQDVMDKLPFFPKGMPEGAKVDDYELVRMESIISSMTPTERKYPHIIESSRTRRIALGSGRDEREVRELLGKFNDMRSFLSAMGGGPVSGKWKKRLKGLRRMFGGGLGDLMAGDDMTSAPDNPFGLPEIKRGKQVSKKLIEKQRKKSKQARKDRKKAKKK